MDRQVALKAGLKLLANEVIDASVLSKKALRAFFEAEIADAKSTGILLSLHLKATMMKARATTRKPPGPDR